VTLQLYLFEAAGRVLVQQARDQRLVGQPFRQRTVLNCLQVLARQADIQSAVLAKRGLGVASVAGSLALALGGGLPFTAINGLGRRAAIFCSFSVCNGAAINQRADVDAYSRSMSASISRSANNQSSSALPCSPFLAS
jgi:hypothetical protein